MWFLCVFGVVLVVVGLVCVCCVRLIVCDCVDVMWFVFFVVLNVRVVCVCRFVFVC